MQSVNVWARNECWDYKFINDDFFELAPGWVRKRCNGNIYALTDVCRLQWLRDQLDAGYERVVWVDADVLIFAADQINISTKRGYAFAHELFLKLDKQGGASPIYGMNNALMVFEREQSILDSYLNSCFETLSSLPSGRVPRTALGPKLLEKLNNENLLDTIKGIGLFTLAMNREIASNGGPLTRQYVSLSPATLGAANLCHFLRNSTPLSKRSQFDSLYEQAVINMLNSRGNVMFNSG